MYKWCVFTKTDGSEFFTQMGPESLGRVKDMIKKKTSDEVVLSYTGPLPPPILEFINAMPKVAETQVAVGRAKFRSLCDHCYYEALFANATEKRQSRDPMTATWGNVAAKDSPLVKQVFDNMALWKDFGSQEDDEENDVLGAKSGVMCGTFTRQKVEEIITHALHAGWAAANQSRTELRAARKRKK